MDMMKEPKKAMREYYAKRVRCYKEAYSDERAKGLLNRFYQLGWFPLRSIFRYTMQYLAGTEPQRALDVGCGTGVYTAALAARGFAVTGLDSCKEMVEATENLLTQSGLNDRAQAVVADYLEWSKEEGGEYDITLAIGVMDCVDDAGAYLASFRRISREVIVTFPVKSMFSFITDFTYRRQGMRGYFYTERQIRDLLNAANLEIVRFTKIPPSTYWVHARRVG